MKSMGFLDEPRRKFPIMEEETECSKCHVKKLTVREGHTWNGEIMVGFAYDFCYNCGYSTKKKH